MRKVYPIKVSKTLSEKIKSSGKSVEQIFQEGLKISKENPEKFFDFYYSDEGAEIFNSGDEKMVSKFAHLLPTFVDEAKEITNLNSMNSVFLMVCFGIKTNEKI